jgi:multiple sugar transport system permease protein
MLGDPTFLGTVRNTAVYALVSIPLCTALALVLAALLGGRVRLARVFQGAVFIPTLVPMVASAMVWSWLFNGQYGLVNAVIRPALRGINTLLHTGLQPPNWLLDRHWAIPALVVMSLWGVGQAVVTYIAALQDVPAQLYEAAQMDGMGPVRRFVNVTLPMISPVVLFNVIVLTINTVQVFAAPYILFRTKDGNNPAGNFYTMYLYDNAFVYGQMGYASAMAWLQLLVILALTGLTFLASRRFVYYRAA